MPEKKTGILPDLAVFLTGILPDIDGHFARFKFIIY